MTRKSANTAKPSAFEAQVLKASKLAANDELASALGAVVRKRLAKPKPVALQPYQQRTAEALSASTPSPTRRRSARRRGRFQSYTPTTTPDFSRAGTFRHYMIALIRRHTDTSSAEAEHATNSEFAGKKLDFGWAASNNYITFD